jgi:hypothetical protein
MKTIKNDEDFECFIQSELKDIETMEEMIENEEEIN